jgi:protocatechuate 3,4-dioxygenase alpha subunit
LPERTPSQTVGPFFSLGLCRRPAAELVEPGTSGAIRIVGRVLDGAGEPVNDALVEIWQADADGRYTPSWGFGRSATDGEGLFEFLTVKPGAVAADDGRVQAPHVNVIVFARGLLKQVHTRMYFPDEEPANAIDHVLAAIEDPEARATLVAQPEEGALRFDIRLQGERETVFFAV